MGTEAAKFREILRDSSPTISRSSALRSNASLRMLSLDGVKGIDGWSEASGDRKKWAGPLSPLDIGSSRACKRRWAPYVRDHDPGQGQLPVSTIKAPGHRIPDARSRTRPLINLGALGSVRNGLGGRSLAIPQLDPGELETQRFAAGKPLFGQLDLEYRMGLKEPAHSRNRFVDSAFQAESESAVLMKRKE